MRGSSPKEQPENMGMWHVNACETSLRQHHYVNISRSCINIRGLPMLGASVVGRPGTPANRRRNSASHLPTFRDLKAWQP